VPRRGLGPAKKKDAKGTARRQIARPRSIQGASLEEQALADALLYRLASRPAYYDGSNVPANMRTFPDEVYLKREHLGPGIVQTPNIQDGSVTRAKIPTNAISGNELAPGSVAGAHISGRLPKTSVPNDAVYGNAQGKLSYSDIDNRPDLSRFLTAVPKAYLTQAEADKRYRKK
jgi:hypothetical protein